MNGWARLPKTHTVQSHTHSEPDYAEMGNAGGLLLFVALNCVVGFYDACDGL